MKIFLICVSLFFAVLARAACPNTDCPSTTGATAPGGRAVIFHTVDWSNNIVVLKNLSGSTIDLSDGDICRPFSYAGFPDGTTISAGGTLRVHLTASGANTATEIFLNSPSFDIGANDELCVFEVATAHQNANMECYVRWGGAANNFREAQAVGQGLWTTSDTVLLPCASDFAFVATGNTATAGGFIGVRDWLVCGATNSPPSLAPITNRIANVGQTLVVTNSATDPNAPPQVLTFSLTNSAAGSAINSTSGVITWRPPVAMANSTNPFTVKVQDNGTPALGASQSFLVVVNPMVSPSFGALTQSGAVTILAVTGAFGPDYSVQATTNLFVPLTNWTTLLATNSPALPFLFTETNTAGFTNRFFRLLLGP